MAKKLSSKVEKPARKPVEPEIISVTMAKVATDYRPGVRGEWIKQTPVDIYYEGHNFIKLLNPKDRQDGGVVYYFAGYESFDGEDYVLFNKNGLGGRGLLFIRLLLNTYKDMVATYDLRKALATNNGKKKDKRR